MQYHTKALTAERLGRILRAARTYHGFTLRHVADLIGVKVSRLHHWEKGKAEPSLLHLQALCLALRLDPAFLFRPTRARFIDAEHALALLDREDGDIRVSLRKRAPYEHEQVRRDAFFAATGLNTDAQEREVQRFLAPTARK